MSLQSTFARRDSYPSNLTQLTVEYYIQLLLSERNTENMFDLFKIKLCTENMFKIMQVKMKLLLQFVLEN